MDQMDIDSVPDVPDTPDRLTAQNIKGKNREERCSNLSMSGRLGNRNLFDGVKTIHSKVNDNRSGKYLIGAPKNAITLSDHRSSDFASGNPSSSNNPSFLLRRVTDEIPCHERKHVQPRKNEKSVYLQTSVGLDGSAVDLTESKGHVGVCKNVFPCGAPGSSRPEEYGKRSLSANKMSSSSAMANFSITSRFANKGKEPKETVSGFDRGNLVNCDEPKAWKGGSTSLSSASLPRVTGQKRLVRNGCISPHNVARAKQSMVKDKDSSDVGANHTLAVVSSCPQNTIGAGEDLDSHTFKGKSMTSLPLSGKDLDAQGAHLPSRNSVNINEIVRERETGDSKGDAFRSFQEPGGWRSTRNRSKKISLPFPYENPSLPREQGEPCLIDGLPSYMVERGEIGSASGTSRSNPVDIDATSSRDASLSSGEQMTSHARSQGGQINRHQPSTNMLSKRQRQGIASSSRGECSGATMDNSGIIFLGSPENNRGKSKTTETISQNSFGSLDPVIEIDETNSEARGDGSSIVGSSSEDVSAMARQIEADEILARELQEQLYNEAPRIADSEIDAHVALALQHGEDLPPVFSRRSQTFHPRNSSAASSSRQSQSSSTLSLLRRGSQARAPTLNRMARLRNRFPGRPRTISSSRERNSLFPADMDVDYRMYILETLEAISDMGVDNGLLQTQRDFNENDYEMLLALDENNHQHGGASSAQINGLPQSTVQSDNFEEACAICLETPTLGDTIRHLPCLHKFHKDCIDPWLRRRTSCPVCKSSIT